MREVRGSAWLRELWQVKAGGCQSLMSSLDTTKETKATTQSPALGSRFNSDVRFSANGSSSKAAFSGGHLIPPVKCSPILLQPGGTETSLELVLLAGPSTWLLKKYQSQNIALFTTNSSASPSPLPPSFFLIASSVKLYLFLL